MIIKMIWDYFRNKRNEKKAIKVYAEFIDRVFGSADPEKALLESWYVGDIPRATPHTPVSLTAPMISATLEEQDALDNWAKLKNSNLGEFDSDHDLTKDCAGTIFTAKRIQ